MEMKKIFLLNMRGDLIQTFLECGAAKYIGKSFSVISLLLDDFRMQFIESKHAHNLVFLLSWRIYETH